MPLKVCAGATLTCSMGSQPSKITPDIALSSPVQIGDNLVATVLDHKPLVHIHPFGICSATNPQVPCQPITPDPWSIEVSSVNCTPGAPPLCKTSRLRCQRGGIISVLDTNQKDVSTGDVKAQLAPIDCINYANAVYNAVFSDVVNKIVFMVQSRGLYRNGFPNNAVRLIREEAARKAREARDIAYSSCMHDYNNQINPKDIYDEGNEHEGGGYPA